MQSVIIRLGAIFIFWLSHDSALAQAASCDPKTITNPPKIVLVGEGHAELVDAAAAPDLKVLLQQSADMRKSIFEGAREGRYVLGSEIYSDPDSARAAPFFPSLKSRSDSGNSVYGIESPILIALSANYKTTESYYSRENPRVFADLVFESMRFDSYMDVWQSLYQSEDPELKALRFKIHQTLEDMRILRGNPAVRAEAELRAISTEVKSVYQSSIRERFTDSEKKALIKAFHKEIVEKANRETGNQFKIATKSDWEDEKFEELVSSTRRARDSEFVKSILPLLCATKAAGKSVLVINVGADHMRGVVKGLTEANSALVVSSYITFQSADVAKLKTDLANLKFDNSNIYQSGTLK